MCSNEAARQILTTYYRKQRNIELELNSMSDWTWNKILFRNAGNAAQNMCLHLDSGRVDAVGSGFLISRSPGRSWRRRHGGQSRQRIGFHDILRPVWVLWEFQNVR
jgi:hypothetical protein